MSETNAVVAVYATHEGAEQGVKELQRAGVDMRTVSIIAKGTHTDEHVVGSAAEVDKARDILVNTHPITTGTHSREEVTVGTH